ncbi:hypothetical protein [Embleya sp. NPDC005971]|uniref:hypothetical protein n=1 Tax=Embleya sp. NPDC005971 TaxID=3156724 RepID=UPI0033E076B5
MPETATHTRAAAVPRPYTVIGLVCAGRLRIAGVLDGEHNAVDRPHGDDREWQRFATSVMAVDPHDAEAHAVEIAWTDYLDED